MANNNKLNVTIACPVGLIDKANQLALTIGLSPADVRTFRADNLRTIDGHDYSIVNLPARASFIYVPLVDLSAKAVEREADPVIVEEVRALLQIWDGTGTPPQANPAALVVIVQPIERGAGKRAVGWLSA